MEVPKAADADREFFRSVLPGMTARFAGCGSHARSAQRSRPMSPSPQVTARLRVPCSASSDGHPALCQVRHHGLIGRPAVGELGRHVEMHWLGRRVGV